jgi:hypothetical protein
MLIEHFRDMPLAEIDQAAIDDAALTLYPNVSPATRNGCVYTPVGAILHHAGVDISVKSEGLQGQTDNALPLAARCFRNH